MAPGSPPHVHLPGAAAPAKCELTRSRTLLSIHGFPGGFLAVRGHLALSLSAALKWITNWLGFLWESESLWRVDDVHGRSLCDSLSPCGVADHRQSPLQLDRRLPSLFVVAPASSALCPSCEGENDSSNFVSPRPDHQSQAPRQ